MALDTQVSRTRTTPIPLSRSQRRIDYRALTSMPAGKVVPIAAFPLLREDALSMSRFRLSFEMMETAEVLANAVNIRVMAYLVPFLAFDRFNGIDQLNRSYQKVAERDGGSIIPFIETSVAPAHGTHPILKYLGKHAKQGVAINNAYTEAYNVIHNFRAANRSPELAETPRLKTDTSLAPAFWLHQQFAAIVPDFDQATIDGEVPLNVVNGKLPVSGIGTLNNFSPTQAVASSGIRWVPGSSAPAAGAEFWTVQDPSTAVSNGARTHLGILATTENLFPAIFAELAENGITVSLSNIEVARKTQAFAALRKQYAGHSDDYIIDLLMSGITIPEQDWRQPMLLADRQTIFGMAKRYASDSTDLTASVVNGASFIDLAITAPRCPTGGVVMITAEIMPEQLFERQADPFLYGTDQALWPEFLRDTLDPEKVEIVQNQQIDTNHATPTGTFGYAPLNWKWSHHAACVGGKFYRPEVDAPTDEDRQRIWAAETANPVLSRDFYLVTNLHTKPFVVTNQDPFECVLRGMASVSGNTVFGPMLVEAGDEYNTVMADVPMDRIDKPASLEASATPPLAPADKDV